MKITKVNNSEIKAFGGRMANFFFPEKDRRSVILLFFMLLMFKFLWFDFLWCAESTFRPFSDAETYIFALLASLILLFPYIIIKNAFVVFVIDILLGVLLECNLLYFRTYYTAIPLSSYAIAGNLKDFTASIYGSMRWGDLLFAVSTIVAIVLFCRVRKFSARNQRRINSRKYLLLLVIVSAFAGLLLMIKGGFRHAYEKLQDSYTHTCGTPMYTVFGSLVYDYIRDKEVYTPETGEKIREFVQSSKFNGKCSDIINHEPVNLIIILAESFESWTLEATVEGQEITPCLNRLISDSATFYMPCVLSQVKGGRSIDAQLMLNAGLLPINTGVYSLKYPHSLYPSLSKAMKQKYSAENVHSYILTADKPIVWNQNIIAPEFGYDSLIAKADFLLDEKVGPHYRRQLGDVSFLRQCAAKIISDETWNREGVNLLQIVTYSGHFPFTLPEYLRQLHFSDDIPAILRDYMTVANYTDRALGEFIEAIRHEPFFDNTLIVITGDHEGLVNFRRELCASPGGRGLVSDKPFVPLIIINGAKYAASNVIGRHEAIMGQIDIFPTLLDMLGLDDYEWKGLGMSALNPSKPSVAVDPHGMIYGDTTGVSPDYIRRLKEAWQVSDDIIKYDYFRNHL